MGRYYNGDIEGKFWFGIQPSNDADNFGVIGTQPNYLDYYFTKEDLGKINKGIALCKRNLGEYEKKLDTFFEKEGGYNDEMLMKELRINKKEKLTFLLENYARLELGTKIKKCVDKKGECSFSAEN